MSKNEAAGHAFWLSACIAIAVVLITTRCQTAPEQITLDQLLARQENPTLPISVEMTTSVVAVPMALPQVFREGAQYSGCQQGSLSMPSLHCAAPQVGVPTRVVFSWPHALVEGGTAEPGQPLPRLVGTPQRYLILSATIDPRPFVQNCTLVGSSEWVFQVFGTYVDIPAPPSALAGSEWGLQALQVDPPDSEGRQRVRLSAGWWARVGA